MHKSSAHMAYCPHDTLPPKTIELDLILDCRNSSGNTLMKGLGIRNGKASLAMGLGALKTPIAGAKFLGSVSLNLTAEARGEEMTSEVTL